MRLMKARRSSSIERSIRASSLTQPTLPRPLSTGKLRYARHGFVEAHRNDGEGDEEDAPDILYVSPGPSAGG
jgi:hypothetical protein